MTQVNAVDVANLEAMDFPELRARFREVVGEEPRSPNRRWMARRMMEALAAQGGAMEEPGAETTHAESADVAVVLEATEAMAVEPSGDEGAVVVPSALAFAPLESDAGSRDVADAATTLHASTDEEGDVVAVAVPATPQPTAIEEVADVAGNEAVDAAPDTAAVAARDGVTVADGGAPGAPPARGRFARMTIVDLQALYLQVVGRATTSTSARYLTWMIQEAERGRVRVGPSRVAPSEVRERFATMTIDKLQKLYAETVGRPTRSINLDYLVSHIRDAERGRIPKGFTERTRFASTPPEPVRVLSLRFSESAVTAIDATWKRKGFANRMAFFRAAMCDYLKAEGEAEVAAHFDGLAEAAEVPSGAVAEAIEESTLGAAP